MENNTIKFKGIIEWEPEHITNKHINQGEWKRTCLIMLGGDISSYYAWFIKKRFHLNLGKPIRGAHVSFINDRFSDIPVFYDPKYMHERMLEFKGLGYTEFVAKYEEVLKEHTNTERNKIWNKVKDKWNSKEIEVVLNVDVRFNGLHFWLNVDHEYRSEIQSIRNELGLGLPNYGLHLTVGRVTDQEKELGVQIHNYIKLGVTW